MCDKSILRAEVNAAPLDDYERKEYQRLLSKNWSGCSEDSVPSTLGALITHACAYAKRSGKHEAEFAAFRREMRYGLIGMLTLFVVALLFASARPVNQQINAGRDVSGSGNSSTALDVNLQGIK